MTRLSTPLDAKLAQAEERVAGGKRLISDMEALRDRLVARSHETAAVDDLLDALRSAQRLFEHDLERLKVMLRQSEAERSGRRPGEALAKSA